MPSLFGCCCFPRSILLSIVIHFCVLVCPTPDECDCLLTPCQLKLCRTYFAQLSPSYIRSNIVQSDFTYFFTWYIYSNNIFRCKQLIHIHMLTFKYMHCNWLYGGQTCISVETNVWRILSCIASRLLALTNMGERCISFVLVPRL